MITGFVLRQALPLSGTYHVRKCSSTGIALQCHLDAGRRCRLCVFSAQVIAFRGPRYCQPPKRERCDGKYKGMNVLRVSKDVQRNMNVPDCLELNRDITGSSARFGAGTKRSTHELIFGELGVQCTTPS